MKRTILKEAEHSKESFAVNKEDLSDILTDVLIDYFIHLGEKKSDKMIRRIVDRTFDSIAYELTLVPQQ